MGDSRSKFKDVCNRCGEKRVLASRARGYCKPCGYEWGNCARCLAYRKIYVSGRCYGCYQDDLVRARLDHIQAGFTHPASEYNQHLFALYLTYVRRYRMSYDHVRPTQALAAFLAERPVPPIRTWNDIRKLSRLLPLTRSPGRPVHDNGCAWSKIGYMLQELGVLGPRADEQQHRIEALLEDLDSSTAEQVMVFVKRLKKSGRTETTLTRHLTVLRSLGQWLSTLDPPESLLLADQASLGCYLELMQRTCAYSHVVSTFRRITAFYRWAKRERLILLDPTFNIRLSRMAEKILICSKNQFDQLGAFLRDPQSDAEQVLAVTLILFYGFTTEGLARATVEFSTATPPTLTVISSRKPRSRGRRYYHRSQCLVLPPGPAWLADLTDRFCCHWRTRFQGLKAKATYPRTPLFLDPQLQHNRNLSDEYLRKLVRLATLTATGMAIPPRVLRQTCGHIMTCGNDASALSHLGWSPSFSFHYTWLPRVRFQPKPSRAKH